MDDRYLKVEGDFFVKDKTNKALLTINKSVLLQNEARKKLSKKISGNDEEINTLKNQIENINSDISEIKHLIKELMKKKD